MTEPARRKWLQVHLSTAVVLMFAAGGILWANVRESPHVLGWPFHATVYWVQGWKVNPQHFIYTPGRTGGDRMFDVELVLLDALIALAILFAVWFVCERWIAWRARRRTARTNNSEK